MTVSSSLVILTTCCPGLRLLSSSAPRALSLIPGDELTSDLEVYVGLDKRQPDLAEHLVDVLLGQPALIPKALEDPG